jgi:hypothetical protein
MNTYIRPFRYRKNAQRSLRHLADVGLVTVTKTGPGQAYDVRPTTKGLHWADQRRQYRIEIRDGLPGRRPHWCAVLLAPSQDAAAIEDTVAALPEDSPLRQWISRLMKQVDAAPCSVFRCTLGFYLP